ncbi:MAG: poly(R)-hydroxyalkanoic acid synthase subunit PhaE, partial [Thiothrix sp.]
MSAHWSDEMLKNWSEAQKRYWDAWSELSRMGQPSATTQPNTTAWTQGIEQWWQAVEKNGWPGATTDAFRRMLDLGNVYVDMAESAYRTQQNGGNSTEVIEAWINAMEAGLRNCCTQLDLGKFTAYNFGIGQTALESWQNVVKNLGLDLFPQMGAGGLQIPVAQNWQEQLSKILATPALGLNREAQERQQALMQLVIRYQEALDDYRNAFAKQGLESVNALRV